MDRIPLISIIVPVYNVEGYIRRCFASIIVQDYPNLECIFVDDCGTDGSMEILGELLEQYHGAIDFKILRRPTNGGLSAARNSGIDAAQGKYLYFLDSDDMITADCLSLLSAPLAHSDVDFVVANFASGGTAAFYDGPRETEGMITETDQIRRKFMRGGWSGTAWNHLVNRDFLIREKLYFCEGLLHEDMPWSFQLACCARSMYLLHAVTYIYIIRSRSIMTTANQKKLDAQIRICTERENFVEERKIDCAETRFWNIRHREQLLYVAKRFGFRSMYRTYRDAIHPIRSWQNIKLCRGGYKIQYLHHWLPVPLGIFYSLFLLKCIGKLSKKH